jgi:hypothetical protein
MFTRFAISVMLGGGILAIPVQAIAQSCTDDTDCGGCGLICSWDAGIGNQICITASDNPNDQGWCSSTSGCACPGQTCVGTFCSPTYDQNCGPCFPQGCDGGVYVLPDGGDPLDAGVCLDAGSGMDGGAMDGGVDGGADGGATDGGTDAGSTSTTGGTTGTGTAGSTGGTTTAGTTAGTTTGAATTGTGTGTGGTGTTGGTTAGTTSTSGGQTSGGTTGGATTTTGGNTGTTAGQSCNGDKDCGTVCGAGGFVCSWATSDHHCVPWDGTDEGYCNGPNDCVCPGQICDLSQQCNPRDSTFLTSSSTGGTTGAPDAGGGSGGGCGCTAQGGGIDLSPIFGLVAMLGVIRSLRRAKTRDS